MSEDTVDTEAQPKSLLDKVRQLMYGGDGSIMDRITNTMWGYDSTKTATGAAPDKIEINPAIPDISGFAEHVTFTFGRFSVPSKGHTKLVERVLQEAGNGQHAIFTTQTHDNTRNPLIYERKLAYMKEAWPEANIVHDQNVRTIFDAIKKIEECEFKSATLVVGADRYHEFKKLLEDYAHEYSITIGVVAVDRADDDTSATMLRNAALNEDFDTFKSLVASESTARKLYEDVRQNLKPITVQSLRERIAGIMNRVPAAGGERDVNANLGYDADLENQDDGVQLRRRKAQKRQKQIIDNA